MLLDVLHCLFDCLLLGFPSSESLVPALAGWVLAVVHPPPVLGLLQALGVPGRSYVTTVEQLGRCVAQLADHLFLNVGDLSGIEMFVRRVHVLLVKGFGVFDLLLKRGFVYPTARWPAPCSSVGIANPIPS